MYSSHFIQSVNMLSQVKLQCDLFDEIDEWRRSEPDARIVLPPIDWTYSVLGKFTRLYIQSYMPDPSKVQDVRFLPLHDIDRTHSVHARFVIRFIVSFHSPNTDTILPQSHGISEGSGHAVRQVQERERGIQGLCAHVVCRIASGVCSEDTREQRQLWQGDLKLGITSFINSTINPKIVANQYGDVA